MPDLNERQLAELNSKTNKHMLMELYVSWFGVPGTDDRGAISKIHQMEEHIAGMNGTVKSNTTWRKVHSWVIGVLLIIVTTIITVIIKG